MPVSEDRGIRPARLVLAYAVSPIVPPTLMGLLMLPLSINENGGQLLAVVFLLSVCSSYAISLVIGLPYFALLQLLRLSSIVLMTLGGMILGPLAWFGTSLLIAHFYFGHSEISLDAIEFVFGAICGGSVALLFSIIAGLPVVPKWSSQPRLEQSP
ncbi:hypothetical protein [Hyphomonas sp.]|uniref:hypothetical protein n=1 Tax=Hyphomonas sp. TaxID=87 RepID=UPI0025BE45DE|nr:hypothetical protein [Hyphomonas sp.]